MVESMMFLFGLGVLFLMFIPVIRIFNPTFLKPKKHCKDCGHEGRVRSFTKGSLGMELLLYALFILPGILYSMSRSQSKKDVCASCGSDRIIPINSPLLKKVSA